MLKRFLVLVAVSTLISSFLLLVGTAILDRVNAAQASSHVQALVVANTKLADGSLVETSSNTANQSAAPALKEAISTNIEAILTDPTALTGKFVTLSGTASAVQNGKFALADGTGVIEVSLENKGISVAAGENITVTGMLYASHNGYDLDACRMVNGQGMVIQLHSCSYADQLDSGLSSTTIAELVGNPSAYYEQNVTLAGLVTLLNEDEFLLNDGTGQIIVDLKDSQVASLALNSGQMITVTGKFEVDGSYVDLDACMITTQDGSTMSVSCSGSDDDSATGDHHDDAYLGETYTDDSQDDSISEMDDHSGDDQEDDKYSESSDDSSDDRDSQDDKQKEDDHKDDSSSDDHQDDDHHNDDHHDDNHDDDHGGSEDGGD
ncbi:MAG: hypothetical protein ACK2UW_09715 [Anaerolineales bacterium]